MPESEVGQITWGQRISYVLALTDAWEKRTIASGPESVLVEEPEPGSPMAIDDDLTRPWQSSNLVWGALVIAVDHLGLAADALRKEDGPSLRPYAFYSLCRAALVPASRAVWLQTGTQKDRVNRALWTGWEESIGPREFFADMQRDETAERDFNPKLFAEIGARVAKQDERIERVKSKLGANPRTMRPPRDKASVTVMLRDVAREVADPDDSWLRRAHAGEWRLASGTAHGLMWPALMRPGETTPLLDGSGSSLRLTTGTEESYGMALAGPVLALMRAWHLWDTRRVANPEV